MYKSLRFFNHSKEVFAMALLLALLVPACNLPVSGVNQSKDTSTPALASPLVFASVTPAESAAPALSPTPIATRQLALTLTSFAPTGLASASQVAPTPTALPNGSNSPADLASFPATLPYLGEGSGGSDGCDQLMTHEPGGAAAGLTATRPLLRGLAVCIWGLALDYPVTLTFISPDGAQRLSGTFNLVQQPDNTYRVIWPGLEQFNTGSATALEGGQNYINLDLWWPGGLAPGDWRIEAASGGQVVSGELVMPAVAHAWTSLQFDGVTLQPLDNCHIVLPTAPERPLEAIGGGSRPGKLLLGLYRRSKDDTTDTLVRQAVMNVPAGADGRFQVVFWLSHMSKDGQSGEFWLVPLTSESQAFLARGDRYGVQEVADCFVTP